MRVFHFKQFSVSDESCAMKLGTDAVLLGAWSGKHIGENTERILDIGTGCGILALMMAQQSRAEIDAVEIDEACCATAGDNVLRSPWSSRIRIFHTPFQRFANPAVSGYDLILSNPPFFNESLLNPSTRKAIARHQVLLGFDELFRGVAGLLNPPGLFDLIFPVNAEAQVLHEAAVAGLGCVNCTRVYPKEGKPAHRILASFSKQPGVFTGSEITIRLEDGSFSPEYRHLTADFYLNF